MRYPAFRAAGLPVGSGEVESSCGTVAERLGRGGMRWSVDGGANPILTLRCWWLDGRCDGFFEARETAADGSCRLNRRVRTNMSYTHECMSACGELLVQLS